MADSDPHLASRVDETTAGDVLKVALDVGPLQGNRTGIGNAVAWTVAELEKQRSLRLLPYVTSTRAQVTRPVRRLPIPAAVAHRWWPHLSPPLDRLLRNPDVVHGTNYVVPPTRCPQLVSVYDCWFLDHPEDAAPSVRRAGNVLRRATAKGATIVASSKATAVRAMEILDTDRVRVVHLGPPLPTDSGLLARRPAGINRTDDSPFLLAIGTTERRKNVPLLIRAFGRVAREHRSVRLVIAGAEGDDVDAVRRAINVLQADVVARIDLLGRVDSAEKSWLLANARALAYPSLDEGFGFPILEAHEANLPVVASTAGSIPEIAANAALLSPPKDVDGLAANLHWVLTSESIHTKLVRRGRRNLERFSWTTTGQQLADLYHDLANGTADAGDSLIGPANRNSHEQ